jgi:ribosomal protein S13
MNELEKLMQQHVENYKKAVLEIVNNNTNSLIDNDIIFLIKKPPLDSMDQIKTKFLALAKKEKIILDTNNLDKMICNFRKDVIHKLETIKKIRIDEITAIINSININEENQVIKITKKELSSINKIIKKNVKQIIDESVQKNILDNICNIFTNDVGNDKEQKISKEIFKFLDKRGIYQKQLLENIDFKILVKDTTLINGLKEQAERYVFTKNNSRLFNS